MKRILFSSILLVFALTGCEKDEPIRTYTTEYAVVIVIDGIRYTESWGDLSGENIPHRLAMAKNGVVCDNFHNNGETYTVAGHTAITTGSYQVINNGGAEYPQKPSLFQYLVNQSTEKYTYAKLIASKDKLEVLSDCVDPCWIGKYRPETDCGISGLGTGIREDSTTLLKTLLALQTEHPKILLVCFKDPDVRAHAGDSLGYIAAIKKSDEYVNVIWNEIQHNSYYKDRTSLFVTNDHGRHDHNFTSHGDGCNGCRHIELLALGPEFRKNVVCHAAYEQIDIAPTIAGMMGFKMHNAPGKIMVELFQP